MALQEMFKIMNAYQFVKSVKSYAAYPELTPLIKFEEEKRVRVEEALTLIKVL